MPFVEALNMVGLVTSLHAAAEDESEGEVGWADRLKSVDLSRSD